MQLTCLSKGLKPLTITASLLSVSSLFSYSDFDLNSGILTVTANNKTSEYINTVDKNSNNIFMEKFRFQTHVNNWEKATMFLSSAKSIIENEDFRAIVSMGTNAVPFIVEEISNKPSTLVWALNLIFDRKITNDSNATITDACKLWVRELKK